VIRNIQAPTQLIDIQKGSNEIAIDLSSDQAASLRATRRSRQGDPGPNVFFLLAKRQPEGLQITPNQHFQNPSGTASTTRRTCSSPERARSRPLAWSQACSWRLTPADNAKFDRQSQAELDASGISNPTVNLGFPSDFTLNGISFRHARAEVQANLQQPGYGQPDRQPHLDSVGSDYRAGNRAAGTLAVGT